MNPKQNFKVIIRCPIHKNIYIEDYIIPIIDSKEFQRLRRISQMGSTTQLYPSATHNRFTHCLGAYEIARRIAFEQVENDFTDYEKKLFIISALLHDLGHGPLSHSFESILSVVENSNWKAVISHEEFTQKIILDKDTEIYKALIKINPNLPTDIVDVLTKKYSNQAISVLISSQVDVDRMDYLLRDSYYTGTEYGKYDLSWITRCMVIKNKEVFYKSKGVQALENYLFNRYFAYEQIYFHPKSLAYEAHLFAIIKRFKDLVNKEHVFLNKIDPILLKSILTPTLLSVKEYLVLDDNYFLHFIYSLEKENDEILSKLVEKLRKHAIFVALPYSISNLNKMKSLLKSQNLDSKYNLIIKEQKYTIYEHYKNDFYNIRILYDNKKVESLNSVSELFNSKKPKKSIKKYIFAGIKK